MDLKMPSSLIAAVVIDTSEYVPAIGTIMPHGDTLMIKTDAGWDKLADLSPGEGAEVLRSMQGR